MSREDVDGLDHDPRQCEIYKTRFIPVMEQAAAQWIRENAESID